LLLSSSLPQQSPPVVECHHTISSDSSSAALSRVELTFDEIPFWDFLRREKIYIEEKKKSMKESVPENSLNIVVLCEVNAKAPNSQQVERYLSQFNMSHISLAGTLSGSVSLVGNLSTADSRARAASGGSSQPNSATAAANAPAKSKLRFTIQSSRNEIHDFSKDS
jgi:methyl coenzyme M reductase alpha subunit